MPKEGENEITSKLDCLAYPSNYTKFSSVNVTGVTQDSLSTTAADGVSAATASTIEDITTAASTRRKTTQSDFAD
jgi:hypothetical protein